MVATESQIKRAVDRALNEHIQVSRLDSATWLARSASTPNTWYTVELDKHGLPDRCTCQGAARGFYCKHLAAVGIEATIARQPVF